MAELTEAQRETRRQQARDTIETRLRETWPAWRRPARTPNFSLAADLAFDSLGDLAAEILVDGTMMRALTIKDGVATLELAEATEMVRIFAAGMRGCLDGHGASNYVEMEMTDGATGDAYTVTVQRRFNPTPHQFRQQAEAALATVMRIVDEYVVESNDVGGIDANDLVDRLADAGFALPEAEPAEAGEQR
ncbi:hypothetical protein [Streptomyces sp. LN590]|uniref:hypothetical protein n=1 Tax=Streptomyces sp. LN590 TaxID=3112980 RepID=UPI0037100800